MPRKSGPERAHFGGEHGLISETQNGEVTYYWKCMYCGWKVGGKSFQNKKARVHLSGDATLKTGLITDLCTKAPNIVNEKFALLERQKRLEQSLKSQSRKRASELMSISPDALRKRKKQSELPFRRDKLPNNEVDDAWALAFFALDIAPYKIDHPIFRQALAATMKAKSGYVNYLRIHHYYLRMYHCKIFSLRYKGPYRQKVFGACLDRLHSKYVAEQQAFLADRKGFGRAVTGDGATIMGTKFINFLVHEFGKGVMLLSIHDCTKRLQEAGTIDGTYIANRMITAIR